MSVFAACRSLLPFAFDMVTQDLLSDVHDANEGHPFKNIAVAMIKAHCVCANDPSDPSVFGS